MSSVKYGPAWGPLGNVMRDLSLAARVLHERAHPAVCQCPTHTGEKMIFFPTLLIILYQSFSGRLNTHTHTHNLNLWRFSFTVLHNRGLLLRNQGVQPGAEWLGRLRPYFCNWHRWLVSMSEENTPTSHWTLSTNINKIIKGQNKIIHVFEFTVKICRVDKTAFESLGGNGVYPGHQGRNC